MTNNHIGLLSAAPAALGPTSCQSFPRPFNHNVPLFSGLLQYLVRSSYCTARGRPEEGTALPSSGRLPRRISGSSAWR